jgi:nucleoside-diphosphate-sugar epimerase
MSAKPKVGILGANGFIGSRLVEIYHLDGRAEVRPIVRRASALASASRFALDGHVADALDQAALEAAFDGCDAVIHAVAGDPQTITGSMIPVYQAAAKAGCQRLIYLSTASVHGQSPAPGTTEDSALSVRQPIEYNNAKVRAERILADMRRSERLETVVLRPGIVFGPRSRWVAALADDLLAGRAYLVDGGNGICNSIYVDNLAHAVWLALQTPGAAGRVYFVGDRETVTWREFYRPVVAALGMDLQQVPNVEYRPEPLLRRLADLRHFKAVSYLASRLPHRLRGRLRDFLPGSGPEGGADAPSIVPTLEKALLHTCRVKLPCDAALAELGYEPPIAFEEACRRSIGWLAFAGYPVRVPGGH